MTKEMLKQYRKLNQEIETQQKLIDSLWRRLENLPVHMGRVQASSKDFPYIRTSVPVLQTDPGMMEHLEKMIILKEERIQRAMALREEIEEYIAGIEDTIDRQIFEGVYIDGLTQHQIATILNMERSTVAHRIQVRLLRDR